MINSGLLKETWFFLPNWQWAGIVLGFILGLFLVGLLRMILGRVQSLLIKSTATDSFGAYALARPLYAPFSWVLIGTFWLLVLRALELPSGLFTALQVLVQVIIAFYGIRLVYLLVDALGQQLIRMAQQTENTLDDQLAPFATKTLKVLVVVLGVLLFLQNTGVNVVSLLAGLGLGGLALALAAQDTAANLIGSITIILDRPFQVGDFVRIGDTEGVIEEVGFRSTRIRTFYKSLVTLPNSTVAKEKIDNLGVRPSRRIRHSLGIVYSTPPEKIQLFCDQIRELISQIPELDQNDIPNVNLMSLGDFSLNIVVNFYVFATDAFGENSIQNKFLQDILALANKTGIDFAFPTQTLWLQTQGAKPRENNQTP